MKRLVSLCFFIAAVSALAAASNDAKDPKDPKKVEPKIDPADLEPIRLRGKKRAPEFADIEAWINSKPLEIEKLKGKVLVVHFMTYG